MDYILPKNEEKALHRIYYLCPEITEEQKRQIEALRELYIYWNERINLISRKDIENLYAHHILHSIGICRIIQFKPHTTILDVGTGGGFPGIPLAILYPSCHFLLVDSTAKKIKVCQEVASSIKLKNIEAFHCRVEEFHHSCHFVVSRAAMPLDELHKKTRHLILKESFNALPNGIIALKGGNLEGEIAPFKRIVQVDELLPFLNEDYFAEKKVVYLPRT